ncbi:MAG: hypothetical protein LJE85_11370 [Gammaproteobacteria bacterium]|jgi:hypothetical protein|nr:hypothetical protein [Gammaproteobacteria bacterium]
MSKIKPHRFWLFIMLVTGSTTGSSADLSKEALEAWFENDAQSTPFSTDNVNEGELAFLTTPPEKPTLHSDNRLTINAASLQDGWVDMAQCYNNLDAVKDAQVVYQYKQLRNLKVEATHNIEKAWTQGQSVQLHNTQKGATLCVSAQVRILYKNPDNTYTLKNGPFQRRFLDGFYPMHVSLAIAYPKNLLTFVTNKPEKQPGFIVKEQPGAVDVDAWFEGMLFTEITFKRQ